MQTFVARQPILDRKRRIFGYEILYRASLDATESHVVDGDQASLSVIQNILLVIGLEKITGGGKAFINFTKNLILQDAPFYLPNHLAVIEILEDVEPDDALLETCRRIKEAGYLLALDDFILERREHYQLLQMADIVKVDWSLTTSEENRDIVDRFGDGRRLFLAEKTETYEDFQNAFAMGYHLFQGYFFSKPVLVEREDVPVFKLNSLRLIREINRPEVNMAKLEAIIKQDPSLVYKLLRYINSAFFGLRHKISSLRHALALLGEREVRKWATLTLYSRLLDKEPDELLRMSLLRAQLLENLVSDLGLPKKGAECFLMGIFSAVDALLGRPLEEALEEVPLSEEVKKALCGEPGLYRNLLELVTLYEHGNWDGVQSLAKSLGLNPRTVSIRYLEAVHWTEKVYNLR